MDYTPLEKQALAMMGKTNFKNPSKNEIISIVSALNGIRQDVAKEIIAQFPEFATLISTSMQEYKGILEGIIASDDESIKQVYAFADKDTEQSGRSREQYYNFAEKILADYSKCLENPDLTFEQRADIFAREREILKAVGDKDTEIRNYERETRDTVNKKDSEKRQFNWAAIKMASAVLVVSLGIAASTLGSNLNIKLPSKQ